MRFGCLPLAYGDPHRTIGWAMLAEECGFDVVGMIDHIFHPSGLFSKPAFDVWVALTAMGSKTKKVNLMTLVTDPVRRHPATTAHAVATLDQFTGGRALLGIGSGEAFNITPLGVPWQTPVSLLKETLEMIR